MKRAKKTAEPRSEPLGLWLWLDTDGRVEISRRVPEDCCSSSEHPAGSYDEHRWLGFPANPPLTQSEAETIRNTLCDLRNVAEKGPAKPAWFFRSDPRTQGDLIRLFREAVAAEAAKR